MNIPHVLRPEFYERGAAVKWYVVRWFDPFKHKVCSLRTRDKRHAEAFFENKKKEVSQ